MHQPLFNSTVCTDLVVQKYAISYGKESQKCLHNVRKVVSLPNFFFQVAKIIILDGTLDEDEILYKLMNTEQKDRTSDPMEELLKRFDGQVVPEFPIAFIILAISFLSGFGTKLYFALRKPISCCEFDDEENDEDEEVENEEVDTQKMLQTYLQTMRSEEDYIKRVYQSHIRFLMDMTE